MYTTNLRKVGGSIMLAVPPAILDLLHLQAGTTVGVTIDAGRLIVEAQPRPRYTLEDLLAQCNPSAAPDTEDGVWLDSPATGRELI